MEPNRLYEVMNLSTVAQVLYNYNLVGIESVDESDNGDISQTVYMDDESSDTVPITQLEEIYLPESEDEYILDALTRWSPIIRG